MKSADNIRNRMMLLLLLFCLVLTGCAAGMKNGKDMEDAGPAAGSDGSERTAGLEETSEGELSADAAKEEESADESSGTEEEHHLIPMECQWQEGDVPYDHSDTIYHKTYYDDFVRGWIRHIEYPDINLKDELEDYFQYEDDFEKWDNLVEMFFDDRTIEMPEEELKTLFYQHGYALTFQSDRTKDLHIRFVEITEMDGLSLYPARIMLQTWDEDHIYLQNITSPIPRKVMSFFVVEDKEPYRLVVHSSGLSRDYVCEEELSFWEYRGTYWELAPMNLEIDTSHAHIFGIDPDGDDLFEASYYRDGIAFRPSRQFDGVNYYTVRLGKMEETAENRIFRLMAVNDGGEAGSSVWSSAYIQFEIKPDIEYRTESKEFQLSDDKYVAHIYYPQLSGMEDTEKEARLNALIEKDVMKILERDDPDDEWRFYAILNYEIKYMDNRIISILYTGADGPMLPARGNPDAAMVTTIDIETEKILMLDDVVDDYDVLNDMLLADKFENTTAWDGEAGQYTVSWEYEDYKETTLMEDLHGDDEDIEWYIDARHFVIVILDGLPDYNEYAVGLRNASAFLKTDFWRKVYYS